MRWARHVARKGDSSMQGFGCETCCKVGRPRLRLWNNDAVDGYSSRIWWRALVNSVMNLNVPYDLENFLSG